MTSAITPQLACSKSNVRMEKLAQAWVCPNWWESHVTNIFTELLIRRDILMLADDKPCWFARTMIPDSTYERAPDFFDRLQQEPLANLIFNEPRVERILLHSYGIDEKNLEYHWLQPAWRLSHQALWMRLCTFSLDRRSRFYLAEIFLPSLLKR
jgi:chorismate lyase